MPDPHGRDRRGSRYPEMPGVRQGCPVGLVHLPVLRESAGLRGEHVRLPSPQGLDYSAGRRPGAPAGPPAGYGAGGLPAVRREEAGRVCLVSTLRGGA